MSPSDADAHLREEPVGRRPAYGGRLLQVFEDTVRTADGTEARREVVEHPGAVAIVATDTDGRVVLVRQWRHATGHALWEVPAGTREPREQPADTARRELSEETGYSAREWRPLGHGAVSPGYSNEEIWFFAASGLTEGATAPDVDESLDVKLFTRGEVSRLAVDGDVDLKTLAGLALAGFRLDPTDG